MHRRPRVVLALCYVLALAAGRPAAAAVKPNPLISEGVVLQQGTKVPLWGTADPGEKIVVTLQGRDVETTARDGAWTVWLSDLKPGGPYELTIRGDDVVRIKEVWVGEVWLCAGEVNLDFPLRLSAGGEQAAADAADPELRFFRVRYEDAPAPLKEAKGAWAGSDPATAAEFSAAAYYFGRDLRKRLGVPVGLIQATAYAGAAEGWVGRPALEKQETLKGIVERYDEADKQYLERLSQYLDEHKGAVLKARAEGRDPPVGRPPEDPAKGLQRPGGLYNGMIAPLRPFALRGVVWRQGESDLGRPARLRRLLPALIDAWRADWGRDDLPFLVVQLSPVGKPDAEDHDTGAAAVREAQRLALREVANAPLVVAAGAGDARDDRPPDEARLGGRLARAARALACGESVDSSGPAFVSWKVEGRKAVVRFTGAVREVGPRAIPPRLSGFTVAGADRRFVAADAVARGNEVVLTGPVANPVAVRYGWADRPRLPYAVPPFRTDHFPPAAPAPAPTAVRPLTRPIPDGALKIALPDVQQPDNYSCGAAALMSVCAYFGVGPEDLDEFKRSLGTDEKEGTNVWCMRDMARGLGLCAEVRHGMRLDDLKKRLDDGAPVICSFQAYGEPGAYYRDDDGHYAVAVGYDDENFYFMDPVQAGRRGFLPAKEFERRWHDDEGTTDAPDPHTHLGLVITRKAGEPANPPRARRID
jgi:sialate O-acetylesterase